MAASEDGSGCLVSRGRSQSDPSFLSDSSATSTDAGENPVKRGKLEMAVMADLAFGCPLVDVSVGGSDHLLGLQMPGPQASQQPPIVLFECFHVASDGLPSKLCFAGTVV
ncbi:hypothetical protein ACRRTK_013121 [Alexandromys fortis]